MNKVSNSEATSVILDQGLVLKAKGAKIRCKNFQVGQKIDAKVKIISKISSEMANEIRKTIKDSFDASVDQASQVSTDMGSAGASGDTTTNIKNSIKTLVEDNLTNQTLNEISNKFQVSQKMEIDLEGVELDGELCTFDQNIQMKLMAQSMISTITKVAKESTEIQEFIQKTKQDTKTQGKGLNDMATTAGNTVKSVAETAGSTAGKLAEEGAGIAKSAISGTVWIAIGTIAALCVVAFIGYLVWIKSPALQKAVAGRLSGKSEGSDTDSTQDEKKQKSPQRRARSVVSGYAPFPPLPAFAGTVFDA